MQATTQAADDEPLALDGKTVRGARWGEQTAPHLLAFVTHQSQETFFQGRVEEKTNEIPLAKAMLPTLPIRQRVCPADALHTHADFLCRLHDLGADGLLTVTGNQPTLSADLATSCADPDAQDEQAETIDRRTISPPARSKLSPSSLLPRQVSNNSQALNEFPAASWGYSAG